MTDTAPTARAPTVRIARRLPRRAAVTLRLLWRAYWEDRVRRATAVILHKLDDRTLADIGVDRDEIDSLIDGRRAVDGAAVGDEMESDPRRSVAGAAPIRAAAGPGDPPRGPPAASASVPRRHVAAGDRDRHRGPRCRRDPAPSAVAEALQRADRDGLQRYCRSALRIAR